MKTTYASIALSFAMASTAFAADLPSRRSPPVYIPPPVPIFTWTGFYAGGQVGYEFGRTTDTLIAPGGLGAVGPYPVGQTGAAIGGGHLGYLYELGGAGLGGIFGGGLVVGLEGDIEGSNNTSSFSPIPLLGDQHKSQIEGSVRGRLGIAVDRALFYATGGAAFGQFHDQISVAGAVVGQASNSRVGYTVGGGAEYAITPNWSLRAEYRYTDFGTYSVFQPGPFPIGGTSIHNVNEQKVELGVSYRFADPIATPVVARY